MKDITDYAQMVLDDHAKAEFMDKTVVLGSYNGLQVVADHPCDDLCPMYTARIVHFAVPPGRACTEAKGIEVTRVLPGWGVTKKFCVPPILGPAPTETAGAG